MTSKKTNKTKQNKKQQQQTKTTTTTKTPQNKTKQTKNKTKHTYTHPTPTKKDFTHVFHGHMTRHWAYVFIRPLKIYLIWICQMDNYYYYYYYCYYYYYYYYLFILTAFSKAPFPGSYKAPYKTEGTHKCNVNKKAYK